MKLQDLTGKKFGRLTVVEKANNIGKKVAWLCLCDCGNKKVVSSTCLVSGHTKSCGCIRTELSRERVTTHGLSKTSELYAEWARLKRRCNNPNCEAYKNYGGRGIKVCDEWNDASVFVSWCLSNGYKKGLTLDRIDNNKGYSPSNCRWVTRKVQANNKRNNRLITYKDVTLTLAQWSEKLNMSYSVLKYRLSNKWDIETAFTTPINKKYSHKKEA